MYWTDGLVKRDAEARRKLMRVLIDERWTLADIEAFASDDFAEIRKVTLKTLRLPESMKPIPEL